MGECWLCRYTGGAHDKAACPETMSGVQKDEAKEAWDQGWGDGRFGRAKSSDNLSYILGYRMGESALEKAENGQPFSDLEAALERMDDFYDY